MKRTQTTTLRLTIALAMTAALGHSVSAQLPTRTSAPRLAVPRAEPVAQPTAQPTAAPAPDASATTAAASPDTTPPGAPAGGVTQVTGAASGVTQVGGGAGAQQTSSSSYAATANQRSYTAGRFALLIEGKPVLLVKKLEGGTLVGDVGRDASGGGVTAKKHLISTKVEEISAVVGINDKPFMDWVAQAWKGGYQRKQGSIVRADFNYKPVSQLDFSNALITETTVPKLDGSSKDAGYFTVNIQPEAVRFSKGDGPPIQPATVARQKQWLTSNFRFDMDGLDATGVATIESFTVRQPNAARNVGDTRDVTKTSGGVEFPNLKLAISQAKSSTWSNWYNDFVVNGKNDDTQEKNGAIVLMTPNLQIELGRINLFNCGIYRLAPDGLEANSDKIARLTAELYCERMELVPSAQAGS